ncbi:MAG: exodeoxyribonuclease III [Candidatus Pacebacteria bacterium]|nr:exodeoxyribonuclease III [Candidatus Paceibacterota bacterium]
MRIVSWNVNGLRAVARKELLYPMFMELRPDVLLLQETKAHPDQLPDTVRNVPSYQAFFDNHHSKGGYSGTAIYTKREPIEVTYGMGVEQFDCEGRMVTAFYDDLIVSNIYFPNGGQGPERLAYKFAYYEAFLEYIQGLRAKNPVIWGGDVNTAHEEIDLARPRENSQTTGFLPEERAWLDEVVALGWIDTFRHFHPTKEGAYSYWDMKTRARDRNVGWRIDYLFASPDLLPRLTKATMHSNVIGSDHCPISVDCT